MKLCVCGLGKVGRPLLEALSYLSFDTIGYDKDPSKSGCNVAQAVSFSDAAIFIVQTPSNPDGSFSNAHLCEALTSFSHHVDVQNKKDYLYIIGSTTTPGSCDKFREIVGENMCYKPEFIRLAHVRRDLLNPAFVLIGSNSKQAGDRCEEIYRNMTSAPVKRMTLLEAELAKITLNCALTMKISLANQLHLVAQKLGANSSVIMSAVGSDPRIGGAYLKPGTKFSGPCLPRDNRMFRFVAESVGVDACLSAATDAINENPEIASGAIE